MQCNIKHTQITKEKSDCLIIGIFSDGQLSGAAQEVDAISNGYISHLLKSHDLTGQLAEMLLLYDVPNLLSKRLLIIGCGKSTELNESAFSKIIAKAIATLKTTGAQKVCCYLTDLKIKDRTIAWNIQQAVKQSFNTLYEFSQFKSKTKIKPLPLTSLQLTFNVKDKAELTAAQRALLEGLAIAKGMQFSKDLSNMPANVCTPTFMAKQAQALAKQYKSIKVEVLAENEIRKLGMNALLAVAKGSTEPAKLIIVHYQGQIKIKDKAPIVLIGKGVTFDSGGISLKTPAGMEEMKYDMCGAASILGTLKATAELQLPLHVIGILPTTENMPDGGAVKPGDIITTMSGQTVEILNTDAEGRLILSDALTYAERFKPAAVIDVATLTGAIILTLGSVASGLMGNNEPLIQALQEAADESWDRVWTLPLWEDYQELITSPFADMGNVGQGNESKSIAAACFLARFASKYPWAHVDIAGTAWKSGKDKSASGRPVPLLIQFLLKNCK